MPHVGMRLQLGLVVPSLLWHQLRLQTPRLGEGVESWESWQRQRNCVGEEGRFLPSRAAFVPAPGLNNKSLWRGGVDGSTRAGLCPRPLFLALRLPPPSPGTGHLLSELLERGADPTGVWDPV